jgi:CBS domain-containing protein
MRIGDVLHAKSSHQVITIKPEASVRELIALLTQHNVGALIVSSDGTTLEGIVSERDVVRRLHDDDGVLEGTVSTIMTAEVATCDESTLLDDLMKTMTERRIRHVPVVEDGAIAGIISIGDVVKHRIDQLEFERDQLDSYVHQT